MDALDLSCLDVESIRTLYNKNLSMLHEKLLSGAEWNDTSDLRNFVTQLEILLDKKIRHTDSIYNPEFQVMATTKSL